MDFSRHNNVINVLLPNIEVYQRSYARSNPRYFQGLKTNSIIPQNDIRPDRLNSKPSDRPTTWVDTGLILVDLPFIVEIHEYPGGWQIIFTTTDGIKRYNRSIGYGPEDRTHDWQEIK